MNSARLTVGDGEHGEGVLHHPLQCILHQFVRVGIRGIVAEHPLEGGLSPLPAREISQHADRHDSGQFMPVHDHVVILLREQPGGGKGLHHQCLLRVRAGRVQDIPHLDSLEGEAIQRRWCPFVRDVGLRLTEPPERVADAEWCEQDVAEHHQHEQGEHALVDRAGVEQQEQQRNLGHPLGHQAGGRRARCMEPTDEGADEGSRELPRQGAPTSARSRSRERVW